MAATPKPETPFSTKLVRELAKILCETELTEIEVERGDLRLRVARQPASAPVTHMVAPPAQAAAPMPAPAPSAPVAAAETSGVPAGAVQSPLVGTAYLRPNPDADNFVKVGDSVKEGDTILLIEAMKTFNPITAPRSGKVTHLLVNDAQPVEFGEPLFVIA